MDFSSYSDDELGYSAQPFAEIKRKKIILKSP